MKKPARLFEAPVFFFGRKAVKQNELKPYLIRAVLELCVDRGLMSAAFPMNSFGTA